MDARRLLIADASEEFRTALSDALSDQFDIQTCRTGKDALSLLCTFRPQVFVLDLMLPELDGITLLQAAISAGVCPATLAFSPLANEYVLSTLGQLDYAYMMMKPCDIRAVCARVLDLCQAASPVVFGDAERKQQIANLLLHLSFPAKLLGYTYLQEAILLAAKYPAISFTKELYPRVGTQFRTDRLNVERSIRNAIRKAWSRRDEQIWRLYFHPDGDGQIQRPSNGVFISRLAQSLHLNPDLGL